MNKTVPTFYWIEINIASQMIWYRIFVTFQRLSSTTVVLIRKMRVANYSTYEPRHEISNNVVCATSKASDKPAHMCSLIRRAFASRLQFI